MHARVALCEESLAMPQFASVCNCSWNACQAPEGCRFLICCNREQQRGMAKGSKGSGTITGRPPNIGGLPGTYPSRAAKLELLGQVGEPSTLASQSQSAGMDDGGCTKWPPADTVGLHSERAKARSRPASSSGQLATPPGRPTRGQKGQQQFLAGHPKKVASQMSATQLYGGKPEKVTQEREKLAFKQGSKGSR
ncbi:hypothetical protein HYC85_028304 [Camellia sinensis]|uniref:Uncharacterized protein n=1 Tax=Camellia sinensis TaxID=4442 RepID=A0A7J7FUS8_CAMSI|nr:hypothetical protein HYC85_028304 [Camellia sinensis]